MICYKDMTFCADEVEIHTCGRELYKGGKEEAERLGLPIAWGSFCKDNKEDHENIKN